MFQPFLNIDPQFNPDNMTQPLHCLLIDDDLDDCEIWSLIVQGINPAIKTDTITEPSEALNRLDHDGGWAPDVIFLDLNMPKMDGIDCLKRIREMDRHKQTPVIIYSTSTNPKDIENCERLGASDYLIKPASLAALRRELGGMLQKHQTVAS
jgi:CheY-like chemotaxis protein